MGSSDVVERASQVLAKKLNRRSFIRNGADTVFGVSALMAAGKVFKGVRSAIPNTNFECETSTGPGCPYGCGPSPCCNRSGRSSACKCGTGTSCKSGGNCHGKIGDWGGSSCWTCQYVKCLPSGNVQFTTTCCDCHTTGCGDLDSICISYSATSRVIGPCGGVAPNVPVGTVIAMDTGNKATSWGDVSMFYKKPELVTVAR